jgi:Tfp pilus assembly protein PilE
MDIYEKKCLVLETTKRKEGFYINENGLAKKQTKQQQKKQTKKQYYSYIVSVVLYHAAFSVFINSG